MNSLNNTLFATFKVFLYLLTLLGIVGLLIVFIVIPKWIRTEEVLVPNITGKTYYEAIRILDDAGLQPAKTIQEASSDAPKGEIIAQNPQANFRIKYYQPVHITVSIGVELTPVPSVIGKLQDAAFAVLTASGFRPNQVASVHSENYVQGTVIAQTPPEGGGQRRGSPINLLVSRGPTPQSIQLPNFQSQLANDVVSTLEGAGLKIETQHSSHPTIPQGTIITHKPGAGTMVQTGDLVLLEISGVGTNENIGRPLPFKHTVSEEGNLSRHIKIVIIDDYGERTEINQRYAPGTVIDLERKAVRVFGKTRVLIYENDEKLPEVIYN